MFRYGLPWLRFAKRKMPQFCVQSVKRLPEMSSLKVQEPIMSAVESTCPSVMEVSGPSETLYFDLSLIRAIIVHKSPHSKEVRVCVFLNGSAGSSSAIEFSAFEETVIGIRTAWYRYKAGQERATLRI